MKLIILFFINSLSFLFGECSIENIEKSDYFYMKANKESHPQKQIEFLEKALNYCYAPEIDSSLLMEKAEREKNITKQIDLYVDILEVIPHFTNMEKAMNIKCFCDKKLSIFYEFRDKETSYFYKKMSESCNIEEHKEKTEQFTYALITFFSILLFWVIFILFKTP